MKILLADDQELMCYTFAGILADEFPAVTICQVNCGLQLEKMARTNNYDIIISDMQMPDKTGLAVLKQLRTEGIKTPFLMVSICPQNQYAMRIFKAGGNGYFEKNGSSENFVAAIKTVLSGKKYISPQTVQNMGELFANDCNKHEQPLSDRELEILQHIALGQHVSEIAALLSLSISTISTYRQRLLKKMNLKTNAELMNYAINNHTYLAP
jgi:two-component system invasion response regulator UvrY